jgi:hypothetical protein
MKAVCEKHPGRGAALLAMVMVTASCVTGDADDASDISEPPEGIVKPADDVSVVDQEIAVSGMERIFLGDGFNTVTQQVFQPGCIAGNRTEARTRKIAAQGRVRLFSTTRALEEEMKFGAGVSGNYWAASASAKVEAYNSVAKSENNLYLQFEGWATAGKSIWNGATLTEEARTDARRNQLWTFLNSCGNTFVTYTEDATYIVGVFVKTEENAERRAQLAASLSAGFNVGAGGATGELSAEQKTRLATAFSSATVAYAARGWTPSFPSGMSFEQALGTVSSMDPTAEGNGVPYKIRVSPYDARFGGSFCMPPNSEPRQTPSLKRVRTFMLALDALITRLRQAIALIDYMNSHRAQFTKWTLPAFDPRYVYNEFITVPNPDWTALGTTRTQLNTRLQTLLEWRQACVQSAQNQYNECGEATAGGADQPAGRFTAAQQAVVNTINTELDTFKTSKPRWVTAVALGTTAGATAAQTRCGAFRLFGYNNSSNEPLTWTIPTYANGTALANFARSLRIGGFWVSDNRGYPDNVTARGFYMDVNADSLRNLRSYVDGGGLVGPNELSVICVPSDGPLGPPPSLDLTTLFGTSFNPL